MKHLSLMFFLIIICLGCESPSNSEDLWQPNARTVLNGTIKNYQPSAMPKKMSLYYYNGILDQVNLDITIDSTGHFKGEFELHHPQDVNLYYRNWMPFLLQPGDSIFLEFDGKQAERSDLLASLKFSGSAEALNTDFYKFIIHDTILDDYYKPFRNLTPEQFVKHHDSLFKLRNAYIDVFLDSHRNLPKRLLAWLSIEQEIVPVTKVVEFPMYMSMFRGQKADSIPYPEGFFDAVKNLNTFTEENYSNGKIATLSNQLLFHYYDKVNPKKERMDSAILDSLIIEALHKDFSTNPLPIQLALSDKIRSSLGSMNTAYVDTNFNKLQSIYKDSKLGEAVFSAYNSLKAELAQSDTPGDVSFLEFNSGDPEDYLEEIVTRAKGKIVYIDHWATWCAPCRSEFKNALPEFKSKYKDTVEFVYFCYQSEKSAWKPLIRKYDLSGSHYFVDEDEADVLSQQMTVDGFPTYTIINQEGKIVKSDFEFRPSRDVTSKIIDSLLSTTSGL